MSTPPVPDTNAAYVIDGNNWLHRCHHAMQPQIHKGRNVAAVRGLRDLAQRIRDQQTPWAVVIVFDGHEASSQRRALFPEYKHGRPPLPDDLAYQLQLAIEHLPRYGFPTVAVDNFEADDVIVQLAKDLRADGHPVFIVSGDKDFAASVSDESPAVAIYAKGEAGWATIRETDVEKKHGVPPRQVLDVRALAGDSSDAIPGVKGIGPKIAVDMIRKYGSLDQLLAMPQTLKTPRQQSLIRENADRIRLYRRLLEPMKVHHSLIAQGTRAHAGEQ